MALSFAGNGTIAGLSVGGLPDGTVDEDTLANNAVGSGKLASGVGGKVLQIKNVHVGTVISGTTNMPDDNSIPQQTEGIECMTLAITPTSATSRLTITSIVNAGSTSSGQWIMALFQDSTASALSTTHVLGSLSAGGHLDTAILIHDMVAGTTSSTTFKIRAGWGSSVFYFNGETYGSRQTGSQGGSLCSRIQIMEYNPS